METECYLPRWTELSGSDRLHDHIKMRVTNITIGNNVVDVQIIVRNNETALAKHVFLIIICTITTYVQRQNIVLVVYSLMSE